MQFYISFLLFASWTTRALTTQLPSTLTHSLNHSYFHLAVHAERQQEESISWMRAIGIAYTTILGVDNKKVLIGLGCFLGCCCCCCCVACFACRRQLQTTHELINARLDRYTITLIEGFAAALVMDPVTEDALVSADVDLHGDVPTKQMQIGRHVFTLIDEDDLTGEVSALNNEFFRTMANQTAFPLSDVFEDIIDQKELEHVKESTGLSLVYPKANHIWNEMVSDEAMKRYFFYGPGSFYVRDVNADHRAAWPEMSKETAFVADCSNMHTYKVRPGFRRYGALAAFDASGALLQIIDAAERHILRPTDAANWEHGKHLLKQSFSLCMTADHLLNLHMGLANSTVNAYIWHLPPRHLLRRLLAPFTFNTTRVNNAAFEALFPEFSILHRTTGLVYSELIGYLENTVLPASTCFQPFPQQAKDFGPGLSKLAARGGFPLISDGLEYFAIVRSFVDTWVARGFTSDEALRQDPHVLAFWLELVNQTARYEGGYKLSADSLSVNMLVDVLAQFIWGVTGWHESVGSVVEFTDPADGFGLRVRPFPATRTDFQSWAITASLVASTSCRMPGLMSRFPNYFEGEEIPVWAAFQNELEKFAKHIEEINHIRRYEYNWFNPRKLECSTSL